MPRKSKRLLETTSQSILDFDLIAAGIALVLVRHNLQPSVSLVYRSNATSIQRRWSLTDKCNLGSLLRNFSEEETDDIIADPAPKKHETSIRFTMFRSESEHPANTQTNIALDIHRNSERSISVSTRSTAMIGAESMEELFDSIAIAIEKVSSFPESIVFKTSLLSDREYQKVVFNWNDTATPRETGKFEFERIHDFSRMYPNLPAITFQKEVITYENLNRAVDQFALSLTSRQISTNSLVAILIHRSIDFVITILAIQRCGAASMPIDPNLPQNRIRQILEQAAPSLTLTTDALRPKLSKSFVPFLIFKRSLVAIGFEQPTHATPVSIQPGDLAHVFFTSGSSGTPKGVAIPYEYRMIEPTKNAYSNEQPSKSFLAKSSVGFTLILYEILSALTTGGHLIITPNGHEKDPARLIKTILTHQINNLSVVPSMLSLMLEHKEISKCSCIEVINTVGENLDQQTIAKLFNKLPQIRLVSFYGCTEAQGLTRKEITRYNCDSAGSIIGRAEPNKRIYILDPFQTPVPVGTVGEIYAAGAISKCYLNDNQLTREKFIPDPFVGNSKYKMYQTGDRARFLPNGEIQFIGRADHQIQIHGNRVEMAEIENAIKSHTAIRECIVVAEVRDKTTFLYSYFTYTPPIPTESELRKIIQETLPSYMMPTKFIALQHLPTNINGKVDRAALKAHNDKLNKNDSEAQATSSEQIRIHAIFCEALGEHSVSTHSRFFDMGGNSLLAASTLNKINRAFSTQIELPDFIENQTIHALSEIVLNSGYTSKRKYLLTLRFKESNENQFIFCTSPTIADHLPDEQNVHLLRALWHDRNFDFSHTLESLSTAYLKEIQNIQGNGPYRFAGFSIGAILAMQIATFLTKKGEPIKSLVLIDPCQLSTKSTRASNSNIHFFWRFLMRNNWLKNKRVIIAQCFNAMGLAVPQFCQEWFVRTVYKHLIGTESIPPYHGTVTLILRKAYPKEDIDLWTSKIAGPIRIIHMDTESHSKFDESATQKIWAQYLN